MINRLVDLLLLLAEMHESDERSLQDLGDELVLRGYSSDEIDKAFSLIQSRSSISQRGKQDLNGEKRQRIFSDWERISLGEDAQRYLLRLLNLGIIDQYQMEEILERIMPFSYEKTELEDIKAIASTVIFNVQYQELGDEDLTEMDENLDVN